jgi:hypothetical protein
MNDLLLEIPPEILTAIAENAGTFIRDTVLAMPGENSLFLLHLDNTARNEAGTVEDLESNCDKTFMPISTGNLLVQVSSFKTRTGT